MLGGERGIEHNLEAVFCIAMHGLVPTYSTSVSTSISYKRSAYTPCLKRTILNDLSAE